MAEADRERNRDRFKAAIGVAVFHALLGYALIVGLGFDGMRGASDTLKLFDVTREPPPPPLPEEPPPVEARTEAREGAASPPNLKATPTQVVQPPPRVRLDVPPPIVAAPAPGIGSDASAGASSVPGPGTGAGGEGAGTGSGRAGSGAGGGRVAIRARHLKGRILDSDYPGAAGDAGAEGTVLVHFTVGADGRTSRCKVIESSGNAELDETTCRIIVRRFVYEPAKDADGRAVADVTGWKEVWWIGPRRRPPRSGPSETEPVEARRGVRWSRP